MKPLIPAVAYVRMSSDSQEHSPKQQREAIEHLAEGKYRIVRWYQDDGISGAESTRRESFQRLITDAKDRADFQAVLCWDQDRFSRFDPIEANYYWHILSKAGVKIVTVTQGELDFADLGGWLTASVTQYGKAQFLRDLSRNVLRARLSNAKQGRYTGGRAPYGYAIEAGQLVLGDPDKIEAVRWMFRQYVDTDTSIHDLAEQLNSRGVEPPTGHGKPWQRSTIQAILNREAYIGRAAQLREAKGKFYTIRNGGVAPIGGPKIKPREEWFYVECPPIIDRDLFDRAREKMTARRHQTKRKTSNSHGLLSGLLYCAHCGRPMVAAWGGKKTKPGERFYQCSTYNSRGNHGCHRNVFREATAIEFLIPKIQDAVLSPANFDRLAKAVRREVEKRRKSAPGVQDRLRVKLAKIDSDLKAATRELKRLPDDLHELAIADLRELKADRERTAEALAATQGHRGVTSDDIALIVDKALGGLYTLAQRLEHTDGRVARGALQTIVDRIELTFEHTQHTKIVRSHFVRGVVRFQTCAADRSRWPELSQLPEVGEMLARWIVESRSLNGPFKDNDDLQRVRGIGPRTMERIKPYLLPRPSQQEVAGGSAVPSGNLP